MALREFTDGKGKRWRVWDTHPVSRTIRPQFVAGWLTFESDTRRRRLAYIPDAWEELDDAALGRLCGEAKLEERPVRRLSE